MKLMGAKVLVTGAASGLGEAVAKLFSEAGASLSGFDVKAPTFDGFSKAVAVDVSNEEQVAEAFHELRAHWPRLDIVINCAGIAPAGTTLNREGRAESIAQFAKALAINTAGTYQVGAHAAEWMAGNDAGAGRSRGLIINTASIAAYEGQRGQCAYAASKGAVASLTLPMARDLARFAIRVMCIAPGVMDTAMMAAMSDKVRDGLGQQIPFPSRFGRPEEFARLAAHIVENDYLNGEVIRLDGALRMI